MAPGSLKGHSKRLKPKKRISPDARQISERNWPTTNAPRVFEPTPPQHMYVCMVITYSKSKYQPGKVANPARGQLNKEN